MHLLRAGIRSVDLVDDDHRNQAQRQRLARDEPRLGHGALGRIHKDQDPVDHAKDALDLAPEVRVPRRVDDVDLRVAPANRGVLGQDRDPPLTLERVRVHHALLHLLVVAKHTRLAKHLIDQGRLPVVDVRDDGDVPELQFDGLPDSDLPGCVSTHWLPSEWRFEPDRIFSLETSFRRLTLSQVMEWPRERGASGAAIDMKGIGCTHAEIRVSFGEAARAQVTTSVRQASRRGIDFGE